MTNLLKTNLKIMRVQSYDGPYGVCAFYRMFIASHMSLWDCVTMGTECRHRAPLTNQSSLHYSLHQIIMVRAISHCNAGPMTFLCQLNWTITAVVTVLNKIIRSTGLLCVPISHHRTFQIHYTKSLDLLLHSTLYHHSYINILKYNTK